MGDRAFFYGIGCADEKRLNDRIFDLAYFFHVSPSSMFDLTMDELSEFERQAMRIADEIKGS